MYFKNEVRAPFTATGWWLKSDRNLPLWVSLALWCCLCLFVCVYFQPLYSLPHFFAANGANEDTSSHHWRNSGIKAQIVREILFFSWGLIFLTQPPLTFPQLQINYDRNLGNLIVHVLQARNLAPRDNDSYSDPFVKVYLLPGRGWALSLFEPSRMSGLCLPFCFCVCLVYSPLFLSDLVLTALYGTD